MLFKVSEAFFKDPITREMTCKICLHLLMPAYQSHARNQMLKHFDKAHPGMIEGRNTGSTANETPKRKHEDTCGVTNGEMPPSKAKPKLTKPQPLEIENEASGNGGRHSGVRDDCQTSVGSTLDERKKTFPVTSTPISSPSNSIVSEPKGDSSSPITPINSDVKGSVSKCNDNSSGFISEIASDDLSSLNCPKYGPTSGPCVELCSSTPVFAKSFDSDKFNEVTASAHNQEEIHNKADLTNGKHFVGVASGPSTSKSAASVQENLKCENLVEELNKTSYAPNIAQSDAVIAQADEGTTQVAAVIAKVDAGIAQSDAGIAQANAGIAQANAAIAQADAGTAQVAVVIAKADAGIAQSDAGIAQADTGIAQSDAAIAQANAGTAQVAVVIAKADAGIAQSDAGIAQSDAGIAKADAGIAQSDAGIAQSDAGIAQSDAAIAQSDAGISQADTGIAQANAGIAQVDEVIAQTDEVNAKAITGIVQGDARMSFADAWSSLAVGGIAQADPVRLVKNGNGSFGPPTGDEPNPPVNEDSVQDAERLRQGTSTDPKTRDKNLRKRASVEASKNDSTKVHEETRRIRLRLKVKKNDPDEKSKPAKKAKGYSYEELSKIQTPNYFFKPWGMDLNCENVKPGFYCPDPCHQEFACNQCAATNFKKSGMISHIKRFHLENEDDEIQESFYRCSECGIQSPHQTAFDYHQMGHALFGKYWNAVDIHCHLCPNFIAKDKTSMAEHFDIAHSDRTNVYNM